MSSGKISFAIGTGRCGTQFLTKLLALEKDIASVHERHALSDTFHRYCKWYNLPVDDAGFLYMKQSAIQQDLANHKFSFESSAFLSLSVLELYKAFNAKFILLVRSPEKVINSYVCKGWYANPVQLDDPKKIPSFQTSEYFHHFLGRTLPKGEEYVRWQALTQVGKLAWFWNTLNREVLAQFSQLPKSQYFVVRLEDLNFETYKTEIAPFIGFETSLTLPVFLSLVEKKPNAFNNVPTIASWNEIERREFRTEVEGMALKFQYDPNSILSSQPISPTPRSEQTKRQS